MSTIGMLWKTYKQIRQARKLEKQVHTNQQYIAYGLVRIERILDDTVLINEFQNIHSRFWFLFAGTLAGTDEHLDDEETKQLEDNLKCMKESMLKLEMRLRMKGVISNEIKKAAL